MAPRLVVVTDGHSPLDELADAARKCEAMAGARLLAEWIGAGRELTTRGVLRPADAVQACALLGIELRSKKPRSALDIDELMMVWGTADCAGFLDVDGRRVMADAGLRRWLDAAPEG